jgi:hypothetical protein
MAASDRHPLLPLDYERAKPQARRIWPLISFGLGLILFMAAATTPFLFRLGTWILPAGIAALLASGVLFAVADRD